MCNSLVQLSELQHAKSSKCFWPYCVLLTLTPPCTVHGFENARYSMREREDEEDAEGQDRVDTKFKLNVKGTTLFSNLAFFGRITSDAGPNTGQSLLHDFNHLRKTRQCNTTQQKDKATQHNSPKAVIFF